jgi:hypothetical protein
LEALDDRLLHFGVKNSLADHQLVGDVVGADAEAVGTDQK